MKILLIDNYDSFTFNLKHLIQECDELISLTIIRNDDDVIAHLEKNNYDGIIIGPGPGNPEDEDYFGENKRVILEYGLTGTPLLGVCLGFQGIYSAFGGGLKIANTPMHGKVSHLDIKCEGVLLKGISQGEDVMRYHSIILDTDTIPEELNITSYTSESDFSFAENGQEAMTIEHISAPIYGMQFHPESFATYAGKAMLNNFIEVCRNGR